MGVVYRAEQTEPIRREVALKLIKVGMNTHQVMVRFEAERQALALMYHPNIAKVLDAGTTAQGQPYFVMEFVEGVPITQYCDAGRVSMEGRLALFQSVCQAIQHAHQKGIIHRDIKPSNVLVATQDGQPVAKVIDFGVDKAIEQSLTEETVFTVAGQLIGTPRYMSPEQAQGLLDIDTRSDVYSLGVLLYELLTGQLPFDEAELRKAGFAEIIRIIREVEPPRPSAKLDRMGGESTTIAHARSTELRSLMRILRGDLDWIVMKCLEKDQARRYEAASALALDVDRFLNHEAILAGPPTVGYRARKFIRRHRIAVVSALGVVLALALGVVGTTAGLFRARRAEAVALREAATSERVAGFMSNALGGADPYRMGTLMLEDLSQRGEEFKLGPEFARSLEELSGTDTARRLLGEEILGRAAKAIESDIPSDPLIAAGLYQSIGRAYRRMGLSKEAEPYAKRARDPRAAPRSRSPGDARSTELMGDLCYGLSRFTEMEAFHRRTFEPGPALGPRTRRRSRR
jgi:non-specific serine/threonine protein kinase/serine/threonine-protein kinase